MLLLKILFDDGDYTITRINATLEEAREYYIGKSFNVGNTTDVIRTCIDIEVI